MVKLTSLRFILYTLLRESRQEEKRMEAILKKGKGRRGKSGTVILILLGCLDG